MYLHKSKRKDGRVYLSIAQGYRIGTKSSTKTIESLGYVDELEKDFADPIAHFSAQVKAMNAQRRELDSFSVDVSLDEQLKTGPNRKNLGFVALSALYHSLGLKDLLDNCQKDLNSNFSLNQIVKLLVYERILNPGSKKANFENKDAYFEKFDFSLDDIYRALSALAPLKERIELFLHKRISSCWGRDTSLVYYDVTNYYFESEVTDDLRKKGFSKENKPDPIVQMGLLTDQNSIPIGYELFAGNTLDCKTLLPVLSRVKKTYGLNRIIVVADKGLNTSDNVIYNLVKKDGYIFSKSVRKADADLRRWVTARTGYSKINKDRFSKSRLSTRTCSIERADGSELKISIEEKQVAIWSRKYAQRAKNKRAEVLAKAQELIDSPSKYTRATHYGACKYIKNLRIDKETGEIADEKRDLLLDKARIEKEEALDGFYIITTSEIDMCEQEVFAIYSNLAKIEASFKVTKTDLRARPVYLSRTDHIQAHFLTCFIALTLMRLLEISTRNRHSTGALISAMRKCSASHLQENIWLFDYRSDVLDDIGSALNIDFSSKFLRQAEARKIVASSKKSKIKHKA